MHAHAYTNCFVSVCEQERICTFLSRLRSGISLEGTQSNFCYTKVFSVYKAKAYLAWTFRSREDFCFKEGPLHARPDCITLYKLPRIARITTISKAKFGNPN